MIRPHINRTKTAHAKLLGLSTLDNFAFQPALLGHLFGKVCHVRWGNNVGRHVDKLANGVDGIDQNLGFTDGIRNVFVGNKVKCRFTFFVFFVGLERDEFVVCHAGRRSDLLGKFLCVYAERLRTRYAYNRIGNGATLHGQHRGTYNTAELFKFLVPHALKLTQPQKQKLHELFVTHGGEGKLLPLLAGELVTF